MTHLSHPYSSTHIFSTTPPHIRPLSYPRIFLVLLVMLRVHLSCCPISLPSPFLFSAAPQIDFPGASSASSTNSFLSLSNFTHWHFMAIQYRFLTFLRSGLGFCPGLAVHPHSNSCDLSPSFTLSSQPPIELFLSTVTVPLEMSAPCLPPTTLRLQLQYLSFHIQPHHLALLVPSPLLSFHKSS